MNGSNTCNNISTENDTSVHVASTSKDNLDMVASSDEEKEANQYGQVNLGVRQRYGSNFNMDDRQVITK